MIVTHADRGGFFLPAVTSPTADIEMSIWVDVNAGELLKVDLKGLVTLTKVIGIYKQMRGYVTRHRCGKHIPSFPHCVNGSLMYALDVTQMQLFGLHYG